MSVGLLTDRITNKSENSNFINVHAASREPVPLRLVIFRMFTIRNLKQQFQLCVPSFVIVLLVSI